MNKLIELSTVSAVTVVSMGLALVIEMALLSAVFACLRRVKNESGENERTVTPGRCWMKRTAVGELRNARL